MIKLVIFDLDGVITSTSIEHFSAWKIVIRERFNLEVPDKVEEKTKGVSRMESLDRILESVGLIDLITDEEKVEIATLKNELYKFLISKLDKNNIYPGVIKLFDFFKERNIKLALGSASKNGPSIIESLGIKDYFDYLVNPAELRSKPSPDIFEDAMNHFGYKPYECIGIEDAISGVKAIIDGGMYAIGIGDSKELNQADIVFENIIDMDYSFLVELIEGDHGKTN